MSGKRILDIELLRGLAVLGVVFHHLHGNLFSGSPALLDGINQRVQFWWGVDLFFAISGFVNCARRPHARHSGNRRGTSGSAAPSACCPRPGCGWR